MYKTKRYATGVVFALVLGFSGLAGGNLGAEQPKTSDELAFSVRVYPQVRVGGGRYYNRYPNRYRYYNRPYYYRGYGNPYYRYYNRPYYRNYYQNPYWYWY